MKPVNLSKIGERWLKSTFTFFVFKGLNSFRWTSMSGWYNTQLNEEIAVSLQVTKLFVNARGEKFAVVEVFSRNPSGSAEHCLANAALR